MSETNDKGLRYDIHARDGKYAFTVYDKNKVDVLHRANYDYVDVLRADRIAREWIREYGKKEYTIYYNEPRSIKVKALSFDHAKALFDGYNVDMADSQPQDDGLCVTGICHIESDEFVSYDN